MLEGRRQFRLLGLNKGTPPPRGAPFHGRIKTMPANRRIFSVGRGLRVVRLAVLFAYGSARLLLVVISLAVPDNPWHALNLLCYEAKVF